MARTKNRTTIFVVTTETPKALFFRKDLAEQAARQANDSGSFDRLPVVTFTVVPVTVTTQSDVRAATKAQALTLLTSEQKAALGLTKKPRAKKTPPPLPATTAA